MAISAPSIQTRLYTDESFCEDLRACRELTSLTNHTAKGITSEPLFKLTEGSNSYLIGLVKKKNNDTFKMKFFDGRYILDMIYANYYDVSSVRKVHFFLLQNPKNASAWDYIGSLKKEKQSPELGISPDLYELLLNNGNKSQQSLNRSLLNLEGRFIDLVDKSIEHFEKYLFLNRNNTNYNYIQMAIVKIANYFEDTIYRCTASIKAYNSFQYIYGEVNLGYVKKYVQKIQESLNLVPYDFEGFDPYFDILEGKPLAKKDQFFLGSYCDLPIRITGFEVTKTKEGDYLAVLLLESPEIVKAMQELHSLNCLTKLDRKVFKLPIGYVSDIKDDDKNRARAATEALKKMQKSLMRSSDGLTPKSCSKPVEYLRNKVCLSNDVVGATSKVILDITQRFTLGGKVLTARNMLRYISVDHNIYKLCYQIINQQGFLMPPVFEKNSIGPHITALTTYESRNSLKISVPNEIFHFQILRYEVVEPKEWPGVAKAAIIVVDCPQLEKFRVSNELTQYPKGHPFHFTIGIKYG